MRNDIRGEGVLSVVEGESEELLQLLRREQAIRRGEAFTDATVGLKYISRNLGLEDLPVVDLLLNGPRNNESVDRHWPRLPQAPSAFPGLDISLGVPVWVYEHDSVCPRQGHSNAPNSSGEEGSEDALVLVESIDDALAGSEGSRAIQAHVGEGPVIGPVAFYVKQCEPALDEGQHLPSLAEEEHPVPLAAPEGENFGQDLELA
mmetsp:Transcript_4148/g.12237  ORF Transcript_4148/g.12237 Transcript_4148/m.12237 type:complete len:204 (-) Transcript_4148:42-653(-)